MITRIRQFLEQRLRLRPVLEALRQSRPAAYISPGHIPVVSPGYLTLWLLGFLVLSGVGMTFLFVPTAEQAASSVLAMHRESFAGRLLHNTHRWSALLLMATVILHTLRVFVKRAYRPPRDINWWLGWGLFGLVFLFGGTGYILRWDIKSFALISLVVDSFGSIPLVGSFVTKLLLGGTAFDVIPLYRGYAFHIWLLPALLIPVLGLHLLVVWRQGLAELPPQLLRRISLSSRVIPAIRWLPGMALLVVTLLLAGTPQAVEATATARSPLPHPDWLLMVYILPFWLFQGPWRVLGTLVLPVLVLGFSLALPRLNIQRVGRWVSVALLLVGIAVVLWSFTQVGVMGAQVPMLGCQACHRPTMVGGAPTQLSEFEVHDPDWLIFHLKDPPESLITPYK